MAAHPAPALDYDTDSTGSLCERHSSWSSDASGSAILSSVTAAAATAAADDAPLAATADALGTNPALLLPKVISRLKPALRFGNSSITRCALCLQILSNNSEDAPDPFGVPGSPQQAPSWDGRPLPGGATFANEEPPLVESSPNWGWYVSTGTPTAPQFSSTSST